MFEESLVESRRLIPANSRWTALISLALQVAVAAGFIVFPLLHPEALPFSLNAMTLTTPATPVPVKPVEVEHVRAKRTSTAMAAPSTAPITMIPRPSAQPVGDNPPPVAGPIRMGGGELSIGRIAGSGGEMHVGVAQPVPAAGPMKALKLSSGVAQGMLLAPIHPIYPRIAIAAHIEGTVKVQAVISKTGTVESLRVLSGPEMLQAAALDAIRTARYAPYRLSGEPVEVDTTFSVVFKLGD